MNINVKRLVEEFVELAKIDSLSLKEQQIAKILMNKLNELGGEVYEDSAGKKLSGNCGNIICKINGHNDAEPILFSAHMDTVIPGIGKKPIVEGEYIKSGNDCVLGADDLSGVVTIIEAIRFLKENNIEHGDIYIVFSIAEEIGLLGARNLEFDKVKAKYGFVMDNGGSIGTVAIKAPAQYKLEIEVKGKKAHAGLEPEKGISAIVIASEAISNMKLGRIDEETTANIGVIKGGNATNIICDLVEIKAEARSQSVEKLDVQVEHMEKCFKESALKYGGEVSVTKNLLFKSFDIDKNDEIIKIVDNAAKLSNLDLILEATGGGSDTNIFNEFGIKSLDLSTGMQDVHTSNEKIRIDDMKKTVEFIVNIINVVSSKRYFFNK